MKMSELLRAFSGLSAVNQAKLLERLEDLPIKGNAGHYSPYHTRNQRCVDCAGEELRKLPGSRVVCERDMKQCCQCLKVKSRTEDFYKDRTKPDGFSYTCKACRYPQRREIQPPLIARAI
jgi:hypothetical protein